MKVGPGVKQLTKFSQKPDFVYDSIYTERVPDGREPCGLLSIRAPERPIPFTWKGYIARLDNGCLAGHTFFVDTGFVERAPCPDEFWDWLLQRKIVVTYGVWSELTKWRENPTPTVNKLFHQALCHSHKSIVVLPRREKKSDYELGLEYYVALLACRKDVWRTAEAQLKSEGVSIDEAAIRGRMQALVGERGMTLAAKGYKDRDKQNVFFDEETLVQAFTYALKTGSDTTILARDGDFVDQLIRFQYLLDSQFRAMLLADQFQTQPDNFIELRGSGPVFPSAFETARFYSMPAGMEHRAVDWNGTGVNFHVDRIDRANDPKLYLPVLFRAHRDMEKLLSLKGRTHGLNTEKLGGRNLHLCIQPCPKSPKNSLPGCTAIVEDKFAINQTGTKLRWALNDVDIALFGEERTGRVQNHDVSNSTVNADDLQLAAQLADKALPHSTRLWCQSNFEAIDLETIQMWFRMEHPSTRIVADYSLREKFSGLLDSVSRIVEHLEEKEFQYPTNPKTVLSFDIASYTQIVDYYYTLLCVRKMFGRKLLESLPKGTSLAEVKRTLLKHANGGLVLSAMQYLESEEATDVFWNERFVATLLIDAIAQGRKTIILTTRPEVVEQFRAMSAFLHGQYLGWHIASGCRDTITKFRRDYPYVEHPSLTGFRFLAVKRSEGEESLPCHEISSDVTCILLMPRSGTSNAEASTSISRLPRTMWKMLLGRLQNQFKMVDDILQLNLIATEPAINSPFLLLFCGHPDVVKAGEPLYPIDNRMRKAVDAVSELDLQFLTHAASSAVSPWLAAEKVSGQKRERRMRNRELKRRKQKR